MKRLLLVTGIVAALNPIAMARTTIIQEAGLSYALPAVLQNAKGELILSWTERSENGNVAFMFARSTDQGKNFGKKQLIHAAPGIGTGRLARPRLLSKKNGDMIAVFTMNPAAGILRPGESTPGGRPKDLQIHFTESKDGGITWSAPRALHQDLEPNVIRGFFDAALMANDELAVVFLKDIPGRPHERDLRIIVTEDGQPLPERVVDPFVCDCCNLGLLTDEQGHLNIYYRENQDDLRDIAKVASTDNGKTFSKQAWVYRDNWIIQACPHNGPQAIKHGKTNLIAYYSGKEADPGVRLVDQDGTLLGKISHATVKSATLVGRDEKAVMLYTPADKDKGTKIAYRTIKAGKMGKEKWVSSSNAANPNGSIVGEHLLLAYEITEGGKAVSIKTELIKL